MTTQLYINVLYYADLNECIEGLDDCSQTCTNTDGGFTCSCESGYQLLSDNKTCEGKMLNLYHVIATYQILKCHTSMTVPYNLHTHLHNITLSRRTTTTTTVHSNDTLVDTPFQLISGFFHVCVLSMLNKLPAGVCWRGGGGGGGHRLAK